MPRPLLLTLTLMSAAVAISLTDTSRRLIAEWRTVEARLVDALDAGLTQLVKEAETVVKVDYLSGRSGSGAGGNTPVGLRSGALRQSVTGERDGPLSGFVGTTRGTTTPYARSILGPGSTTITPKRAKHLWVPIADNLNPSGIARYTPRSLFAQFGDRVKIFESRQGNTVVFVEEPANEDGSKAVYKRDGKRARKGQTKGKLMFVLKDQVVIHGTDALAQGVASMADRGAQILQAHLQRVFPGPRNDGPRNGGAA